MMWTIPGKATSGLVALRKGVYGSALARVMAICILDFNFGLVLLELVVFINAHIALS